MVLASGHALLPRRGLPFWDRGLAGELTAEAEDALAQLAPLLDVEQFVAEVLREPSEALLSFVRNLRVGSRIILVSTAFLLW